MPDQPELHEDRRRHFAAYKQGEATIFVIRCKENQDSGLPPFIIRKIDDNHVAILAWRGKDEAERYCAASSGADKLFVDELRYSELMRLIPTSELRDYYRIELI